MTAAQAIAALEAGGWTPLATGDWSWVLLSPGGTQVARVSPWDAAYRLHAELCRRRPIRHVQRIDALLPLGRLGHVILMERLWPAPEEDAAGFCAALDVAGDSGWRAPDGAAGRLHAGLEIARLRDHLRSLGEAGAQLPFWGGFDVRPGNVMQDEEAVLKLVDPAFVSGPKIIAAIEQRDREALLQLPEGALAAFFQIPPFQPGGEELKAAAAEMGFLPLG
jgi:hypothetical protein